jgi:osmotically-inducible protein OsmY
MEANGSLYTNVMEKLRFQPEIGEANITIAIKADGIVILGGKVGSYIEKRLAEDAVKSINGVKGVANELEVELLINYKRNDSDIIKAALNALEWDFLVPDGKIKVTVEHGYLTLTGEVKYNYQKEHAKKAVQDLNGVTFVSNEIKVESNIKPADVKAKIIEEFERNARIDANNIQIEVDGEKVTLKGEVRNFDEEDEPVTAAWSVPGVDRVIDELEIK